ncbi:MAG: MBL fold metallo-hydrolase [Actinomycetia bacterium]|nr:MBL fold metallo-hydrolase [Actinomycetes bacterium]
MQDSGPHDVERRRLLHTVGVSAIGVAIFGVVAASCSSDETTASTSSSTTTGAGPATTAAAIATTTTTATVVTTTTSPVTELVSSKRVNLDFVSAYVIDRGDGLVVIDTGVGGSAPAIHAAIEEYGKSWADVGYVVATHKHGDHVGSLGAVLALATDADVFAGVSDIPDISSRRSITPLAEGDLVNGIQTIATPGHTPGHISLLDPDIGLFTGDALNGASGGVTGPNPGFTPDLDTAHLSVKKLATFTYEQAFFGHGEPVLVGASDAVSVLAGSL